jgi:4-amino-4-deoxy-L-arabinose transferase-like glycosyltransferase
VTLVLVTLIAIVRVVRVDRSVPQGLDEPCHIAAGIKWLENRDYTLDPMHTLLGRYAVSLPLFLKGVRSPNLLPIDGNRLSYCTELGNAILNDHAQYTRNLFLARSGMLPFLSVAVLLVFIWTRRLFGVFAACIASFLFSTLPSILAFSGLAYTDLPTACTQFACLFAFAIWLEKPTWKRSLSLGVAAGLALSSKLTSLLFLPAAGFLMVLVKYSLTRNAPQPLRLRDTVRFGVAMVIGLLILWGSYTFSVGHLQDALEISSGSVPEFLHVPKPVRPALKRLVAEDPVIPMPELIRGIQMARTKNAQDTQSYLLGRWRTGCWYFFPVALGLKTPIPFLLLSLIGCLCALRWEPALRWRALVPAVAAFIILVATFFVGLRIGTRHLLVVLPLFAITAGLGALRLWQLPHSNRVWGRFALFLLLAWQAVGSIRAQSDLLAYFNELTPTEPAKALVTGCDFDCGQDLFKLADELRARHVTEFGWGLTTSADVTRLGIPPFHILEPRQPVAGWVAVSARSMGSGQFGFAQNGRLSRHPVSPRDALLWVERYQPVAYVGKTIRLYYIPESETRVETRAGNSPSHSQ